MEIDIGSLRDSGGTVASDKDLEKGKLRDRKYEYGK